MTEQYLGWALVVGIALGGALVWFVVGRLPRRSDDVSTEERAEEARWISRLIESRGGVAPVALVDEILELGADYVAGPPLDVRPATARQLAFPAPPEAQPDAAPEARHAPPPAQPDQAPELRALSELPGESRDPV